MAVTGQNIIDKVQAILSDVNVYWPALELLAWLNAGLKEIALLKPNALVAIEAVQCVAGTKQTVPVGALMLVDVLRNMGALGTMPGRAITPLARQTLDAINPDWHSAAPAAVVKHFHSDLRYPKAFYVYPPQPSAGQGYIEIAYGVCPPPIASAAAAIPLDDIYENVLVDYVSYRAFIKDSTEPERAAAAKTHYAAFASALGAKVQAEAAMTPPMPGNNAPAPVKA